MQVYNAKCNLDQANCSLEYSDNYSKIKGSLWQSCRDKPNNTLKNSESFELKSKFTKKNNAEGVSTEEIVAR